MHLLIFKSIDTDSLIYTARPGEYRPMLGDLLGQMTDEIQKDYGNDAKCIKFASNGCKNYGIEVKIANGETRTSLKVKGAKLNYKTMRLFNFNELFDIALKYSKDEIKISRFPQMQIVCDRAHVLKTTYLDKIYRTVCDKRVFEGNASRPYGTCI